jgi:uncharacterized RDD family membrane protein YckC
MSEVEIAGSPISSGAGFWIRAGARIIDVIYGIVLGFFAGILAAIILVVLQRSGFVAPGWQYRMRGFNPPGLMLSLLGGFLYHSITEGLFGASLGKLICQLRVVSENGNAITFPKALLRSLAYYWDALFFGLVAYSSMRQSELNQRYGDKWAHTVVVSSKDAPVNTKRGAEIFVLALLMGSVCWMVLIALGAVIHAR